MPAGSSKPAVELVPITRENWLEAAALRVSPDQEAFVPPAIVSIAKGVVRPDGPDEEYRPYAVMADGVIVGFGQLAGQFGVGDTLWLNGFLIDERFQGRGLGRAALEAFVGLVSSEPNCTAVQLTVQPRNAVARGLYERAGFRPTSEVYEGELVYRLELNDGPPGEAGSSLGGSPGSGPVATG